MPACRHGAAALLVLGLISPWTAQAQAPAPFAALTATLDSTLDQDAFGGAHWGVAVMNVETGTLLYQRNLDKRYVPASNVKLYTTAAALEQLGPNYRYQTPLFAHGTVANDTLRGDLIVRGTGDPTLGGYAQRRDPTRVFRAWADSLRAAGIRHVTGSLIGDDNLFADAPFGWGWSWDDLPYSYAAPVGGLVFHQNMIDLTTTGQQVGAPARLTWQPINTGYAQLRNETVTVAAYGKADEEYARTPGRPALRVQSRVPQQRTFTEELAVPDPTAFFVHVLGEVLRSEGITVAGRAVDLDRLARAPDYAAPTMQRVATYTSPPLAEIVQPLNIESLNLYAEQVLRTLGTEHPMPGSTADPGTAAMGIEAALRTVARAGVDTSQVQLADGSGLSRHNIVTPRATATLLRHMWAHPDTAVAQAFYASLPQGGLNGTLAYRYQDGASARGNVRAKTGTLSNMSSLSGYVRTAAGVPLAFVLMCNQYLVDGAVVRRAQDAVVNALARFPMH